MMEGGTVLQELKRSAELLVEIGDEKGVYYVVALLYDMQYDLERIKLLLPILEKQRGAQK